MLRFHGIGAGFQRRLPNTTLVFTFGIATDMLRFVNSSQAKRYLAKKGARFSPGKGGHLIVELNGRRSVLPQHGGSKELGKGLWLAILKQLDIKE